MLWVDLLALVQLLSQLGLLDHLNTKIPSETALMKCSIADSILFAVIPRLLKSLKITCHKATRVEYFHNNYNYLPFSEHLTINLQLDLVS